MMNDNLKYLRNENKQQGDAEEAQKNTEKLAVDNVQETEQAETQKPEEQKTKSN